MTCPTGDPKHCFCGFKPGACCQCGKSEHEIQRGEVLDLMAKMRLDHAAEVAALKSELERAQSEAASLKAVELSARSIFDQLEHGCDVSVGAKYALEKALEILDARRSAPPSGGER